nr:putative amidase C869.01 [Ipomoea batatas]
MGGALALEVNAYVEGENPCGSSSGSVAANLATVSLGTETDGSIFCPALLTIIRLLASSPPLDSPLDLPSFPSHLAKIQSGPLPEQSQMLFTLWMQLWGLILQTLRQHNLHLTSSHKLATNSFSIKMD